MRHFKTSEFDCKSKAGSGLNMDKGFLEMIDNAREYAEIPFLINSGYRTKEYNQDLIRRGYKASPNSSHMKGKAADIHINSITRDTVIDACIKAGFKRIGVAITFVHIDNDNEKRTPAVWVYGKVNPIIRNQILSQL